MDRTGHRSRAPFGEPVDVPGKRVFLSVCRRSSSPTTEPEKERRDLKVSTRAPVVPIRKRKNVNPAPVEKPTSSTRKPVIVELPKVYLPAEAADALKVSRRTVERYIERGSIKAIRFAGRNLITEEELARVLREGIGA